MWGAQTVILFENSKTYTDLENADLANKDLENTDVSQTQKQPLLASVMNLSPLVRLFFFFSRSAFSRSVVCVSRFAFSRHPAYTSQKTTSNKY